MGMITWPPADDSQTVDTRGTMALLQLDTL